MVRVVVVDDSSLNRKIMKRAVHWLSEEFAQGNIVFTIEERDDSITAMTLALVIRCLNYLVLMNSIKKCCV